MSTVTFSREKLDKSFTDIETYLGYLRGNENAWDYLRAAQKWFIDNQEGGILSPTRLDEDYAFPCPEAQYRVKPYRTLWLDVYIKPNATFDRDPYIKALQQSTSMAWQDGAAWARGVGAYCRSVCDPFTKPDVDVMADAVRGIKDGAVSQLVLTQLNDDWASLGGLEHRWTGEAATSFSVFYQNFNDVYARLGRFLHQVNMGFAAGARVINAAQLGAQTTAEEAVKSLREQLGEWARWDMKPPSYDPAPPWVGNLGAVAKSTLAIAEDFPVVGDAISTSKDVLNKAGKVETLLKDLEKLTGRDILPEKRKNIPFKSADEIYSALTSTLYDDYLTGYHDGLDALQAGAGGGDTFSGNTLLSALDDAQAAGQWSLPKVRNVSMKGADDDY